MSADVYIFYGAQTSASTIAVRKRIAGVCRDRGWNFQPRPVQISKAPNGRPVLLISRELAVGLYPRAHRAQIALLVLGGDPRVQLDPEAIQALRRGKHVPLRRYLDYKAFWARISTSIENDGWAGAFQAWLEGTHCEGEHDPRCLPFHVFEGNGAGLSATEARTQFNDRYGTGAERTDDTGQRWRIDAHAFHGQDELTISGCRFRAGFHWDVTGGQRRISTPAGIWQIDGHVNVYPDAHLRPGPGHDVRRLK